MKRFLLVLVVTATIVSASARPQQSPTGSDNSDAGDAVVTVNEMRGDELGGIPWTNIVANMLQLFLRGGPMASPVKSEPVRQPAYDDYRPSPWSSLISVGLKIMSSVLNGDLNQSNNEVMVEKVDYADNEIEPSQPATASSPLQGLLGAVLSTFLGAKNPDQVNAMTKQTGEVISIVVTLMDALKTSLSH